MRVLKIGYDIGYDVRYSQCHSLRNRGSLSPGFIMPARNSLSCSCPGFLHPLFAQFYCLPRLHRNLTRKGPSMAPHPHVDIEQPAQSRSHCRGLILSQLPFGSYPWSSAESCWLSYRSGSVESVAHIQGRPSCSIWNIKHRIKYSLRCRVRYQQSRNDIVYNIGIRYRIHITN